MGNAPSPGGGWAGEESRGWRSWPLPPWLQDCYVAGSIFQDLEGMGRPSEHVLVYPAYRSGPSASSPQTHFCIEQLFSVWQPCSFIHCKN